MLQDEGINPWIDIALLIALLFAASLSQPAVKTNYVSQTKGKLGIGIASLQSKPDAERICIFPSQPSPEFVCGIERVTASQGLRQQQDKSTPFSGWPSCAMLSMT